MQAANLDRTITIQKKAVTQNDSGDEVETWSTLAVVSAEKLEGTGGERFTSQQFIAEGAKTFRIRWSKRLKVVTTEHRISFDDRIYDIVDVQEIGRREGLRLDCRVRTEQPVDT